MKVSIKAEHLSLTVPTYLQPDRSASRWGSVFFGAMFDPPRRRPMKLLDDVSFTIHDGERMALLGQNGAGKSTLLKVLNGAYAPTSGKLSINGRIQALINMNLGFHNQATVRENIFLRGTAMGLSTAYIRKHVGEILDFADIAEKVNQRLYTLSSGQKMRLGLAISTQIQQDILLLDEWIATGDANFRVKAKERLEGRVDGSGIVVLASHQVGLLRSMCNRGMVVDNGRLLYIGDIGPAIEFYQEVLALQWTKGSTKNIDFSDGRPLVYGYVDDADLLGPGKVRIKGWMACTQEERPERVVMKLGESEYAASKFQRCKRGDVVKRFAVDDPESGFLATFDLPGIDDLRDLIGMEVVAGLADRAFDTVLRQSDKLHMIIHTGVHE